MLSLLYKAVLRAGPSLGGRALFLLFIHTGGDYGGEGGLGRVPPARDMFQYVRACCVSASAHR